MCRREVFDAVGGFDETLTVAMNDVSFCLKIMERGWRNIYLPHVVLYHYESRSRGPEDTRGKKRRLKGERKQILQSWQKWVDNDPYYNPHLSRQSEGYRIRI